MNSKRHGLLPLLTSIVLLVVVVAAGLYFFSDLLVNSPWMRAKIGAALSRESGGVLSYRRLTLELLPRPRAVLRGVSVSVADIQIHVPTAEIDAELSQLLLGTLRLNRLELQQPQIVVALSEEETPFDPRKIEAKLLPVFRFVARIAPDVRIGIRQGLLTLTNFKKTPVTQDGRATFTGLDIGLALSDGLVVNGRCSGSPWGAAALKGRFSYTPGILQVDGAEAAIGRNVVRAFSGRLDWRKPTLLVAAKTGQSDLTFDDIERWSGRWLTRAVPHLKHIGGDVLISSASLEGPLRAPADWRFHVSGLLRRINLETEPGPGPARIASAAFEASEQTLAFEKAEVAAIDSGLQLAGQWRFKAKRLETLSFSGEIGLSTIQWLSRYVPVLQDAVLPGKVKSSGCLSVQPGLLQIKNMDVATGQSSLSGLTARIEFGSERMSRGLPRGKRANQDKTATLGIGDSPELAPGSFQFGSERIPRLEAVIRRAVIVRREFGLWGDSALKRAIPALTEISGTFRLMSCHLEGPLEKPEKWRVQTVGTIERAAAGIGVLPAPVRVDAAEFSIDGNRIEMRDVHGECLDTAMTGSALFRFSEDYDLAGMDLAFDGSVGEQSIRWIHDRVEWPDRLVVPKTLSVSAGRLNWQGADRFILKGLFKPREGLRLTVDMSRTPDGVQLRDSGVQDDLSNTAVSLDYQRKKAVTFNASGTLHKKTVEALYRLELPEGATLTGELKGRVPLEQPHDMTVTGRLQVNNIRIPLGGGAPVIAKSLDLKAVDRELTVERSDLFWMGHPISLRGHATAASDKMIFDADVKTDRIVYDELIEAILQGQTDNGKSASSWFSRMQLGGHIRVSADRFDFRQWPFMPFSGEIVLCGKSTRIFVSGTRLCMLPVAGSLEILNGGLSFAFQSRAENLKAAPVLKCLTGERTGVTGTFSHRLELQGDREAPASLRGDGEIVLTNGRIYRFALLSRILEFLNITRLVMGDIPELGQKGTLYDTIRIRYHVEGEEVLVDQIQLNGPTLRIAGEGTIHTGHKTMRLTLLVSPLRTVDKILGKIPVVKNFRNIIAIPVGVSGDWSDPTIIPLAPSAVGTHLYELMKSVVRLPFTLLNP